MTTRNDDTNDRSSPRDSRGQDREGRERQEKDGGTRRGRHGGRKERVLHTRISEQLAEDIRNFAEDLRVPASNLVRNVLEEVFTIVDSVSGDMGDLMEDVIDEAEGVRERVRRQAMRHRGSAGRRSRRGRRSRTEDVDVEKELRQDEAAERDGAEAKSSAEAPSREPARPSSAELFPEVLGWQPLVLNRETRCGRCERALHAGESAFLGMTSGGLTDTALCGRCASSGSSDRR